jgi:septal ring factor EnvC (AmiA/AmiB activator)
MFRSAPARASTRIGCAFGVALAIGSALAQTSVQDDPNARKNQLNGIEKQLQGAQQQQRQIESALASIKAERARLVGTLLEATRQTRAVEDQAAEVEARLATAQTSEQAIRQSLSRRKTLISLVLASLQRMSRKPPPAVLVDPDDMLSAIRASMLLGALLPEMHQEVASLAADLADLANARAAVASEKARLATVLASLGTQRRSLQVDIDARQAVEDSQQKSLAEETSRAHELAKQASDIKDLISKMESAGAGKSARTIVGSGKQFGRRRGDLPFPVAGALMKTFGESNDFGAIEKGDSFAAVPGAVVAAPADSTVAYSGPYRTYGQLLILNAGEGYYLVMAGMDRINVEVGQSVVAGEPVALMGDGATKTAATIAVGAVQPVLYVEFRKDGTTIDPGPWWARPELEKARG